MEFFDHLHLFNLCMSEKKKQKGVQERKVE